MTRSTDDGTPLRDDEVILVTLAGIDVIGQRYLPVPREKDILELTHALESAKASLGLVSIRVTAG